MRKLAVVALISALSVSSCAFLFGDVRDIVMVKTTGKKPVSCKIKSGREIWNITAPSEIRVDKTTKNIKISCSNKKSRTVGYLTVKPTPLKDFEGSYDYPEVVTVKMYIPKKTEKTNEETFFADELDKPLNKLPDAPEEEAPVN